MPNLTKYFTFHDVLLSYQPIGTADPAQVGQIGHAYWLVAQKDIVENYFFWWFWVSTSNFDHLKAKLEMTHFSFIQKSSRSLCIRSQFKFLIQNYHITQGFFVWNVRNATTACRLMWHSNERGRNWLQFVCPAWMQNNFLWVISICSPWGYCLKHGWS